MVVLEEAASKLTCPSCDQSMRYQDGVLDCTACSETVPVVDGVPHFPVTVDRPTVSTYFDLLSPIYETPLWFPLVYRVIGGPTAPANDRAVIADVLDVADDDVLDVACGTGRFTRYIASDAAFGWGIDVSEGMLRNARRYADRRGIETVAFARMDAENLRFDDDSFDSVACCWALHLFPDIPGALREIRRVLKRGGRFAGATLSEDYLLAVPGIREGMRRSLGARVFETDELRDLLRESGFTAVEFDRRGAALFFGADG